MSESPFRAKKSPVANGDVARAESGGITQPVTHASSDGLRPSLVEGSPAVAPEASSEAPSEDAPHGGSSGFAPFLEGLDSDGVDPAWSVADAAVEPLVETPGPAPASGVVTSPQLLRARPLEPTSGPRRWVHALTGGLVNLGPSAAQLREQERMARIQRPLRGAHVTTYLCLKGGITKTTTCIGTALTAAQYRPEAVVAGDFNPDAGDLAERVTGRAGLSGVTALAEQVDRVSSIGQLSAFLESEGRLTVLPGEPDPKLGESLTSAEFNAVIEILSNYYSSIHVDAGTGITHPIMPGILARTDTLVVPAAYSVTGAKRAFETLVWLRTNGFDRLADTAIVALTERDVVSREVNKDAVLGMFQGQAVVRVPADRHLADGAKVYLERMQPRTREAFAEIAALIADRYPA